MVLVAVALVLVAAVALRAQLRHVLEPRGLWPTFLVQTEDSAGDAGPAAADAGAKAVAAPALDAGAAIGSDAGAASQLDAGAAGSVVVDAGAPGTLVLPAVPPPPSAAAAVRQGWLEARCPSMPCVDDVAKLLRKRPTRAQRLAAERALDRCVARCAAVAPSGK